MPQLDQLPDVLLSQLFWMALVLGFIYFVIGRGMVPRIQSTVDSRDQRIADDLAAAEKTKAEADAIEEAYRTRMDASRAEASRLTLEAKQQGAKASEKRLAKADSSIQSKIAKAEEKIRASREAAVADVEAVAAEIARELAAKVGGIEVGSGDAMKAVREVAAHG